MYLTSLFRCMSQKMWVSTMQLLEMLHVMTIGSRVKNYTS